MQTQLLSHSIGNAASAPMEYCEASPVGIVHFRARDFSIVGCNEQAWRIVGIDSSDAGLRAAVSESIDRLVPLADQGPFRTLLEEAGAAQPPTEFDTRIRRADGTLIEIACWLSRLPNLDEQEGIYQLVIVDVTQKRDASRAKSRARRAQELALIYDTVLLVEPNEQRARCLKFAQDERLASLGTLRVSLSDAVDQLIEHLPAAQDQTTLKAFIEAACHAYRCSEPFAAVPQRMVFAGRSELTGKAADYREAILVDAEGGAFFPVLALYWSLERRPGHSRSRQNLTGRKPADFGIGPGNRRYDAPHRDPYVRLLRRVCRWSAYRISKRKGEGAARPAC